MDTNATRKTSPGNISEGKYLDVLRKQEDGSWKCLVHTWEQIN